MGFAGHITEFNSLPVRHYQPGQPAPDNPSAYAWKISVDHDEWEEWEGWPSTAPYGQDRFTVKLREFTAQPWACKVSTVVIGANVRDAETSDTQIIAAELAKLPLTALFCGDITSEEWELSWIGWGELRPLFEAIPGVELLTIRGSDNQIYETTMEPVSMPRLRKFVYESGGLPEGVLAGIVDSDFPALTDLELWLGIDHYGGISDVAPLEPLLTGTRFPMLTRLGLCNSEIQDAVASAVAESVLVSRVSDLALSLGALTDAGADALATSRLAHVKTLDIHHHYVSDEAVAQLRAALPDTAIDASDPQEPKKWERNGEERVSYSTFVAE